MDGFSSYNHIQTLLKDQHKTTFICPWGMFYYYKISLSLKMSMEFHRVTYYVFHEITHIMEDYLDDLVAQSKRRVKHIAHL